MKILKRILAVCSFCTLLTATNCFAVTLNKTDVTDNKLNCYRTYLVQSGEQNSFIENIDKEIENKELTKEKKDEIYEIIKVLKEEQRNGTQRAAIRREGKESLCHR